MLPRKVREAAERADKLHAQIYGNTGQQPAPAEPAPTPPVEPNAPVETPPDSTPAPAVPEPTPAPVVAADPWEEKYRVLNGKYQAEVPRMAAEIRDLKTTMQTLQERPAATPAPAPQIDFKGMTPEQVVEQFGEDFASAVAAIADQRAGRVRDEVGAKLESVEKRTTESARGSFMRDLDRMVPDWQALDVDDRFTAYLDEVDGLSGRSRRFFFQEADKHNDAARVAKFFAAFRATVAPAAAAQATPAAVEQMLQPSSSRVSEQPVGKRIWRQADIRQFYVDVRRGRYSPQEVKRLESDIFAAQHENRLAA